MGGGIVLVVDVVFEGLLDGLVLQAVLDGPDAVELVLLVGAQLL